MVASWVLSDWFQSLLFILTFAVFMGLMEFFRWFPSINLYLALIATIVFFPIQIGVAPGFDAGGYGTTAKFCLIVPFLVILCGWRLAYMPIKTGNIYNQFQAFTIRFCKKLFCCMPEILTDDKKRPTLLMESVWFLLACINIMVAVPFGFMEGNITNPIAGILLAFSFPIPARLLKLNYYHGVYMSNRYNNNKVYDGVADGLTLFWVVSFTSWDLLFVFAGTPKDFLIHSFHLVPNCVRCIFTKQYDLWAELRIFTFAVTLCMMAAMRGTDNPINDWYLDTQNVDFIMKSSSKKAIIEIWGSINLILAIIHCIIWIKELIRRKNVRQDEVDQILIIDTAPQNNIEMVTKQNSKVVIIGGGPAGIHMCSLLHKSGWNGNNITILEKSNRIGGKAYSVQDKGNGHNDDIGVVHEMGTCYAHPDYHVIFDLIKEYDPQNELKGIPSRGMFGTHMNENENDHKEKHKEKHVDFTNWLLAQSEELAIPKEFHWINDKISGGLAFIDAARKYCMIWKEIFGEQIKPKRYGFPPRPRDEKQLERINCSFLQFVQNEGVDALIPFFVYSQTVQGYGVLDKIPAFYGLYWNNPQLVMAPVWTTIIDHPAVFVVKKGFQSIIDQMAKKHKMNIIKNCQIQSIDRFLWDNKKKTKIRYLIQKDKEEIAPHPDVKDDIEIVFDEKEVEIEIECDYLILACGVKKALSFLSDATDREKEIFGALKSHTFCSAIYESSTHKDNLHEQVVELWPKIQWAANGNLGAQRNTLKCWLGHEKYAELVKNGTITTDRSVTYQYEIREPLEDKKEDAKYFREKLLKDLELWGEEDVKIIFQKVFGYHPIWNNEKINAGYPWIVRDEMQGKNKNTFYIGSSVSFESILNVIEYNFEIFDQYLFGVGSVVQPQSLEIDLPNIPPSVHNNASLKDSEPLVIFDETVIDQKTMHRYNKAGTLRKLWTSILFAVLLSLTVISTRTFLKGRPILILCFLSVALHCHYFGVLLRTIFVADHLYRIYPIYKIIKHHVPMSFPNHIKEFPKYSVVSLSELSAIRGTPANYSLVLVSVYTFSSFLALFIFQADQLNINSFSGNDSFAAYTLCLAGNVGFTCMSYWELNPHDIVHVIMHYIGVICAILSNVACCIVTKWSIQSILIMVVMFIAMIIWQVFCLLTRKTQPSNDPKYVRKMSLRCLLSEITVLLCASIGFNYFLFVIA
eukprot:133722_1